MYFKIFKIIRRHERQIHAQNKVNMEIHARDNGSCSTQQLQTLNTRETRTARAVAYHLYPLAETVTFLNLSLNPFIYCWWCKDVGEKSGLLYKEQNIYLQLRLSVNEVLDRKGSPETVP